MKESKLILSAALAFSINAACAQDPLPSWNDTAPKKAITAFVEKVTKPGTLNFLPVAERIATFDNDATLWCEQPMYFQASRSLDATISGFVATSVSFSKAPIPEREC
jgi:hypothetical protein